MLAGYVITTAVHEPIVCCNTVYYIVSSSQSAKKTYSLTPCKAADMAECASVKTTAVAALTMKAMRQLRHRSSVSLQELCLCSCKRRLWHHSSKTLQKLRGSCGVTL